MTTRIPILRQIRQQLAARPKPETENSVWLRVLVQALVIVGIVATDIAGETFGTGESVSLWAVPLSIVGGVWSWYRRRDRNIPTKFGIALGMLAALAFFLWRLREEFNDTRLVLAGLLIHLQVLHSFDLPRRKDLGYSVAIGLILLGVAATVSQTMAFAPLLLVFLAIALPILVLDYRSRLGLKPLKLKNQRLKTQDSPLLNFKFLIVNFTVIVALGLTIFAFLPRLPGYQIRTFPISSPIEFTGPFDGSSVINPGYRNRGRNNQNQQGGTGSGGRNIEDGPGELDPTFYYGFNTKINQNLRGQLEPTVVMRVRSQAEGFWRVLGFDRYTGQGWEVSRNETTFKLDRPWWSYRFYIPNLATVSRTKEVIQSYTIVSDLPNLIPAMAQAEEVYFPTQQIAVDTEGGLRSPPQVGLPAGVTYSVVSNVPYRDRTLLSKAPTKYPKTIQQYYLQVPPKIKEKVRKLTEEILANQNKVAKDSKPLTSPYEKALYLAQYLKQHPNYKLQKAPPFLAEGEDLVEAFLFGYKNSPPGEKITGGYGDHFSTVLTIMLRSIGIPARLIGGFAAGEFNPFTGFYVVRNTDAYLLTEVFFPKYGWFTFDPIPGHPLYPPSVEEDQTFSVLRQFWQWVAGWLPTPVSNFLGAAIAWLINAIAWFVALFAQGWIGLFTGLAIAIALGFCFWVAWDRWRVWHYRRGLEKLPPMESIYRQMLDILATLGYRKHPAQTPLEYASSSRQHHDIESGDAIDEISQAYVRWRYGGESPNVERSRQRLQQLKKQILASRRKNLN